MKPNWLKERLTPVKRGSRLWGAFTDALQAMWEASVEPVLTRISDRKSLFTMDSADMDTRISEYGRFFVIASTDKTSRPMLLTQRLDEIHFKGTYQPLEQTFWREFEGLPITWEPLYAPVALDVMPYGSFFATERELVAAEGTYGEFFLTSRGRLVVDMNELDARYGEEGRDKVVQKAIEDFRMIVAPLIPLHIVYDGLTLQLIVRFNEQRDCLQQKTITVSAKPDISETPDVLTATNTVVMQSKFPPAGRSTESIPVRIDTMALDCWPLGITAIVPPVIPGRYEDDMRLYEKALTRAAEPALILKTLSLFGCLVEYTDGKVVCYGFPWVVDEVVLQPAAGDWRRTIRKLNYLHSIDEVKTYAGLTEAAWRLRVACHESTNQGMAVERKTNLSGITTMAEGTIILPEDAEQFASAVTAGQLTASALKDSAEGYIVRHDTAMQNIRITPPADEISASDNTVSLSGELDQTPENVAFALTDTFNGRIAERTDYSVCQDTTLQDNRTFVPGPMTVTVRHDIDTRTTVAAFGDRSEVSQHTENVPDALAEQRDAPIVKTESVMLEEINRFRAAPRSLVPSTLRLDDVPLDAWMLGQDVVIPPIFPGRDESDPRLYEKDGALIVTTLDQAGCLIEYATGALLNVLFPADKAEVILQDVAGSWRKDIHKIIYRSH